MKSLMSINHKFFSYTPTEFFNLINGRIDGVEIYLRNSSEYYYPLELANLFKENLIINIHGNIENPFENQQELIGLAEKISDIQHRKVNIVLHSKTEITKKISINKTIEIIKKIKYDTNKVSLSLENLNNVGLIKRLSKDEIKPIIESFDNLYFTYDMGHEIIEKGNIVDVDKLLLEKLNNVHFHTYSGILDHEIVYSINEEIRNCINYLKSINYDGFMVFEYDFNRCRGNSYEERIDTFIESMNLIIKEML